MLPTYGKQKVDNKARKMGIPGKIWNKWVVHASTSFDRNFIIDEEKCEMNRFYLSHGEKQLFAVSWTF